MKEFLNTALYGASHSAIRQYTALAAQTPGCIGLTLGEPDFDTPTVVRDAAHASLENHETHYIANNGAYALREKIAAFEREKHGLDYAADEVIVTAGATGALFTALFGILNPGDEVIIPTPAFVLYAEIVKLCRGVPVFLDTSSDGFQIRAERLNACVTGKTKAILLNSPNNPTGCVLDSESLQAVRTAVEDKPIFVVCDDVYRQLVYTENYHSFAEFRELKKQILLVQSFSKPYAMTGWRVGYLMADAAIRERLELIHQFSVVSTPAPFQNACAAALDCDVSDFLETYRKRRRYVLDRLAEIGLPVTLPEGAFYVFPSIAHFGLTSSEFCTRMIREGKLAATPGSCFGGEGHIRLSYCYSDEILAEGMNRLQKFVESFK